MALPEQINELYVLGRTYPLIAIVIAFILFFISLKITKLAKWVVMGIAIVLLISAIVMFFR